MELVYFENSYWEDYTTEANIDSEDVLASISIDGFPEDPNESGEVIATVWITKHKDIVVNWHNNAYRMNEIVLELIEDSKRMLKNGYYGY